MTTVFNIHSNIVTFGIVLTLWPSIHYVSVVHSSHFKCLFAQTKLQSEVSALNLAHTGTKLCPSKQPIPSISLYNSAATAHCSTPPLLAKVPSASVTAPLGQFLLFCKHQRRIYHTQENRRGETKHWDKELFELIDHQTRYYKDDCEWDTAWWAVALKICSLK